MGRSSLPESAYNLEGLFLFLKTLCFFLKIPLLLVNLLDGLAMYIEYILGGYPVSRLLFCQHVWVVSWLLYVWCICEEKYSMQWTVIQQNRHSCPATTVSCYPLTPIVPLECYGHRWRHSWPCYTQQPSHHYLVA